LISLEGIHTGVTRPSPRPRAWHNKTRHVSMHV
jgi:hypothetical protein